MLLKMLLHDKQEEAIMLRKYVNNNKGAFISTYFTMCGLTLLCITALWALSLVAMLKGA